MTKKTKILGLVILVVLVLAAAGYFNFKWFPEKIAKIERGLASDKFPWRDFTQDELNKMYPQIKYADVPTRVTPEETYEKFREALITNNLELALEQLSKESGRYEENKSDLEKAHGENRFVKIHTEYPDKLEKEYMAESIAQLYFLEDDGSRYPIDFVKDANGDWKMGSL